MTTREEFIAKLLKAVPDGASWLMHPSFAAMIDDADYDDIADFDLIVKKISERVEKQSIMDNAIPGEILGISPGRSHSMSIEEMLAGLH